MTNPKLPAEPAEPAQPKQPAVPFTGTGGYVQPPPSSPGVASPIPGGAPPGGPNSQGSSAPSPGVSPSAPTGPVGASGIPPAAQSLGLDQKGYEAILEDMRGSVNQEEFQTQFTTLMDQKQMLAPRTEAGTSYPTEDYGKYLKKWVSEAINYAQAPVELGGKGYTPGQAKMMAIVEARRRWADITPQFWTEALPGKLTPKDLGVSDIDPGAGTATVEVSPMRAARLDPTKIADILTKKDFKHALEWAREYKETTGTGANATGFVQYVFNKHVAGLTTGGENLKADVGKAQASLAQAEADKAAAEAAGTDTTAAEAALLQAKAAKEAAEAKLLSAPIPDKQAAFGKAVTFVREDQELLSVAAALAQLH